MPGNVKAKLIDGMDRIFVDYRENLELHAFMESEDRIGVDAIVERIHLYVESNPGLNDQDLQGP